jgi:hypothetical protein
MPGWSEGRSAANEFKSRCTAGFFLFKIEAQSPYELLKKLPHVFRLEDEGAMCFSIPIIDNTNLAGIGVYTTGNKEQAIQYAENVPAVKQKIFTYEIVSGMGLQHSALM